MSRNSRQVLALTLHTGYAAAHSKLVELQGRANQLESEIREIEAQRSRGREESTLDKRAQRLIRGERYETVPPPPELTGKREELVTVRRAIELQRHEVDRQSSEASREICARPEVQERHRAIVRQVFASLLELGRANAEHYAFVAEADNTQIAWTSYLRPMAFFTAGDPRDPDSRIASWLIEAVVFGFVDPGEIPAEWREKWSGRLEAAIADRAPTPTPSVVQRTASKIDGWLHAEA